MNAERLREVGGMDESFFMYFEETDLALRGRLRGYRNVYFAPAKAVHLGGQSVQEVKSGRLTRMFYANWKRYLLKHHGPAAALLVRLQLAGYYRLAAIAHRLRGNGKQAAYFRAHLGALGEGWAGRVEDGQDGVRTRTPA
jgi:GT2 family glycosyltransferase